MFNYVFTHNPANNSLHLRFTNNRRKAEMSLGIFCTREELDEALSMNTKPKNLMLSSSLDMVASKIKMFQNRLLQEGRGHEDVKVLRDMIRCELFPQARIEADRKEAETEEGMAIDEDRLFGRFFVRCMELKHNRSYRASYDYTLKKMKAYAEDFDALTFEDMTIKWLNAFDEWLVKDGASKNTRNIHFKNIRTCINRAIDDELTVNYPFRRFKIRPEETRKRSLNVKDLRKLFSHEVEPYQRFYRDMFGLIFMLCGINTVDLYNLEEVTDGRIEYRRAKTHRLYSIKVEPEAMDIIERYRGRKKLLSIADRWADHRDFNKQMNIALKKIGQTEIVGRGGKKKITAMFPMISTYWARHTWSTIAYSLDVPKDIISQALGHSSGSPVTEIYIERDREKVDRANRMVIDWVLYGVKTSWR